MQRFDEPAVAASTNGSGCPPAAEQAVTAASYRLRFEDGPHDAETLLVDPRTSQVFIITKSFTAGALYAAPNPLKTGDVNVLRKVADVGAPAFATGGDIAPDGKSVAVRNYWEIDIRSIPDGNLDTAFAAGARVQRLDCTRQQQAGRGTGLHSHGPRLADVLRRRKRTGLPDPTGGHHGGRYDAASRDGGDAQPPEVPGGVTWSERGGRCRCGHKGQLYALRAGDHSLPRPTPKGGSLRDAPRTLQARRQREEEPRQVHWSATRQEAEAGPLPARHGRRRYRRERVAEEAAQVPDRSLADRRREIAPTSTARDRRGTASQVECGRRRSVAIPGWRSVGCRGLTVHSRGVQTTTYVCRRSIAPSSDCAETPASLPD